MIKKIAIALSILILAFVAELSIQVAMKFNDGGYSIVSKLPRAVQRLYFSYTLQPTFGYFRNCARKHSAFRLIESDVSDGRKNRLSYDRRLLIPYLSDGYPMFSGVNCPILMEPLPRIAKEALISSGNTAAIEEAIAFYPKDGRFMPVLKNAISGDGN
ncbi:hypothetical protein K1W69_20160 [Hoeflea sp. WL0058]|uniref:Uncharacterized protein n=1 Tax=Flavimaribacter sediminis TaxID=2865987 RepID=A0AAE3D2U0_9HYPH|nr:hypothetical protein [Flavimaribacter sediminis]MBW8639517.1 hypothetical protein [Flavimaribacter sediminis]